MERSLRMRVERAPARRFLMFVVVLAMVVPAIQLVPPMAPADASAGCTLSVLTPWKSGTNAKTKSVGSCTGGAHMDASFVSIQEQFGVWLTRASEHITYDHGYFTRYPTASCAGHGTDNWRNYSYTVPSTGTAIFKFSGTKSITC